MQAFYRFLEDFFDDSSCESSQPQDIVRQIIFIQSLRSLFKRLVILTDNYCLFLSQKYQIKQIISTTSATPR